MNITIKMETGNAAFQTADDIADALNALANRFRAGQMPGKVMDGNGNAVGVVEIDGEFGPEEDFEDDEPEDFVDDVDESMDGDHQSGLASAGWGTDEDYDWGHHETDEW